jgi:hypothetical protein
MAQPPVALGAAGAALEAALDARFAALQATLQTDMAAQFAAMTAHVAAVAPGGTNLQHYRDVNKSKNHSAPFISLPGPAGNVPPAHVWPAGLCYDTVNEMSAAEIIPLLDFYALPVAGTLRNKRSALLTHLGC